MDEEALEKFIENYIAKNLTVHCVERECCDSPQYYVQVRLKDKVISEDYHYIR